MGLIWNVCYQSKTIIWFELWCQIWNWTVRKIHLKETLSSRNPYIPDMKIKLYSNHFSNSFILGLLLHWAAKISNFDEQPKQRTDRTVWIVQTANRTEHLILSEFPNRANSPNFYCLSWAQFRIGWSFQLEKVQDDCFWLAEINYLLESIRELI